MGREVVLTGMVALGREALGGEVELAGKVALGESVPLFPICGGKVALAGRVALGGSAPLFPICVPGGALSPLHPMKTKLWLCVMLGPVAWSAHGGNPASIESMRPPVQFCEKGKTDCVAFLKSAVHVVIVENPP